MRRLRPYESLYNHLRTYAARREHVVDLTYEEFVSFTRTTECYYCGDLIGWRAFYINRKGQSGCACNLDRLNNSKGYSVENCVVCCRTCNFMKKISSRAEFLERIRRIYEHLGLSGDDGSNIL